MQTLNTQSVFLIGLVLEIKYLLKPRVYDLL